MSSKLVLCGLLLGLDSLAVGVSLGGLLPRRGRRLRLSLWFAVCDGLASLLGSTAGFASLRPRLEWGDWLGPAAVAGYGAYVLYLARRSRDVTTRSSCPGWLAFSLPVALSLDNLVAGTPTEAATGAPVVSALILGLISGALALGGLSCGAALAGRRGAATWRLSGALLIGVAAALLVKDSFLG